MIIPRVSLPLIKQKKLLMLQLFLWALMWHTVAPQCSSLTGPQVSPQCNSLTLILPQLALQHFDPPSRLSPISQ